MFAFFCEGHAIHSYFMLTLCISFLRSSDLSLALFQTFRFQMLTFTHQCVFTIKHAFVHTHIHAYTCQSGCYSVSNYSFISFVGLSCSSFHFFLHHFPLIFCVIFPCHLSFMTLYFSHLEWGSELLWLNFLAYTLVQHKFACL